ncbi:unnamed protein product [Sphenostylis stenocarpa]|uniref:ATP synthase YMF19 uncharacterized C-terminal domain-containing protein n=1 Tax=Sphenostylis stenocarpa TaxID=92480 RepID=A0AA86T1J5_9FABA|nr:unnamed protein product [Sphenostylis stenocarpa]
MVFDSSNEMLTDLERRFEYEPDLEGASSAYQAKLSGRGWAGSFSAPAFDLDVGARLYPGTGEKYYHLPSLSDRKEGCYPFDDPTSDWQDDFSTGQWSARTVGSLRSSLFRPLRRNRLTSLRKHAKPKQTFFVVEGAIAFLIALLLAIRIDHTSERKSAILFHIMAFLSRAGLEPALSRLRIRISNLLIVTFVITVKNFTPTILMYFNTTPVTFGSVADLTFKFRHNKACTFLSLLTPIKYGARNCRGAGSEAVAATRMEYSSMLNESAAFSVVFLAIFDVNSAGRPPFLRVPPPEPFIEEIEIAHPILIRDVDIVLLVIVGEKEIFTDLEPIGAFGLLLSMLREGLTFDQGHLCLDYTYRSRYVIKHYKVDDSHQEFDRRVCLLPVPASVDCDSLPRADLITRRLGATCPISYGSPKPIIISVPRPHCRRRAIHGKLHDASRSCRIRIGGFVYLFHLFSDRSGERERSLEDIFRKGFSTGVSYMYSSFFEVSQWCNAVDLLGKRRKITFLSCFGEISGSRGMERNIFYLISNSDRAKPLSPRLKKLIVMNLSRWKKSIAMDSYEAFRNKKIQSDDEFLRGPRKSIKGPLPRSQRVEEHATEKL